MPVSPPLDAPAIVPNYWSFSTLSFNRSLAYPDNPEYAAVFPNDLHVYDINGDGHLDILQVYAYIPGQDLPGIPIRVLLGDGAGNFTDGTASLFPGGAPLGDAATGSTVADFNGDGVLDIFIGMTWETTFEIERRDILLLSDGNGGVIDASSTLPDINDYTHWTAGADIDGDGDVDLFACNIGSSQDAPDGDDTSHFLINDGTGHFVRSDARLPATIENGYRLYISSLLFDADNDGDTDLLLGIYGPQAVLSENGASSSLLLFNDGNGTFLETADSNLPAPLFGADVAVMNDMDTTDLNGDGYADLVMLTGDFYTQYGIQVLINNGDGTFRDETQSRLPLSESLTDGTNYNTRYLHLTDINADGALDLVLETGGPNRFFLNDGSGHFVGLPDDFLFAGSAAGGYGFVPGDFNEDGRTDFFVRTIINSWDDPNNVTEFDWIALWNQPAGTVLSGNDAANAVLGIALAETLSGLGGDDVLSGGAGDDSLSGGAGADVLIGGAGNDMFRDTAAGLNGDTIADFSADDRIVVSNANLAGFTFNLIGNTLTFTGGSLTLNAIPVGTITASVAAGGGVQLTIANDVRNDFNGDERSDVLWRSDAGQLSDWLGTASGGFVSNDANAFTNVPVSWQVAGTGDFNGDGRDDILWRNTDGTLSNWLGTASGGFVPNDANAAVVVPTNWHVVGTGDFNGDGRDDILWRSDAGQLSDWLGQTNGGFANNDANAFTNVPTNWHVVGTGDFNGDGRDDVLWRSDAGQLSNWLGTASGGFTNNDANAFASVPTNWQVVGTGDFNGDGYDDILWRSDSGQLSDWLGTANGGFVNNDANAFATVPTNWQVVAVGDYNGDGRDDILWRNESGALSDWLGAANGGFVSNDANAFNQVSTDWHVQPLDYF